MRRNTFFLALLTVGTLAIATTGVAEPTATPPNFAAAVSASYMDDPRRNEWQRPAEVLDLLQVKAGDTVVDLGAGTGYFSLRFAQVVGVNGTVHALDTDLPMVQLIDNRARRAGLTNVHSRQVTTAPPQLTANSVDLLFICDTYLFLENRVAYLAQLRESLKPTGRLAIISFNERAEVTGAPPPRMMINKATTIREAEQAGLTLATDSPLLPYQDFLIFTRR